VSDRLTKLMDEAATDYVGKTAGWPKRTELCDRS